MMTYRNVFVAALSLAGCEENDPEKRAANLATTQNPDVRARVVAKIRGCEVWQLGGPGISASYVYTTICPDDLSRQTYGGSGGKNPVHVFNNGDL